VRATALGSIIASHLILICKRNPAETALAGFEHPRSAPQHSVEILSVGVGCDVHVARPQFGDSVRATALGSIIASHLILIHKEMQRFARFAAFESAQRGPPHSPPKHSQWGGVCSGGGARRVCGFGVCRLHCEHALIMLDLYS